MLYILYPIFICYIYIYIYDAIYVMYIHKYSISYQYFAHFLDFLLRKSSNFLVVPDFNIKSFNI